MQNLDDDPFQDAPPDPDFGNEDAWFQRGAMQRHQPAAFTPVPAMAGAPAARFSVDWIDSGRLTEYPADPGYPRGVAIDVALDAPHACRVELPWPAERIGQWVVICRVCGYAIALSTAGRADDPHTARLPCRPH